MIQAGTGSGKTLAMVLPTLVYEYGFSLSSPLIALQAICWMSRPVLDYLKESAIFVQLTSSFRAKHRGPTRALVDPNDGVQECRQIEMTFLHDMIFNVSSTAAASSSSPRP